MDALKETRQTPKLRFLARVLALVLLAAMAVFYWRHFDPHAREVRTLISQLGRSGNPGRSESPAVGQLVRLGPKAYPELARILRRHDSAWERRYDELRGKTPKVLRRFLPVRLSNDDLRAKANGALGELGPMACRQLVGAIHDELIADQQLMSYEPLRCLYWSIPESPMAVDALRVWLSRPAPRRMLFGMKDADEIWPRVPQLAPLLVEWLQLPDQAREAADGLGLMGTNAVFAIPALIDTFDNGVAGHPPRTNLASRYAPGMNPLQWNRTAALTALGRIGVASSNVLAALDRGIGDPEDEIRIFTADAIGTLGSKALPLLPKLLEHLDGTNRFILEYQIEALGKLGPGAIEAIPILKQWASRPLADLPPAKGIGRAVRWFDDPPPLPGAAAVALLRIAPPEAAGFGKAIASALLPGPNSQRGERSLERLRSLRSLADEIVSELEAGLADTRQWVRQLAAFQILCLQPQHARATALLKTAMNDAEPVSLCVQAAVYYWRVTGDTAIALPVLARALESVRDSNSQPQLNYAAELGPAAQSLVPQIQVLLTNDHRIIRELAGKALRRIDPKLLD